MAVILKIFSGLHLGAEIELDDGIYVIGTDDSCDLILGDSSLAPRHAALRVTTEGESTLVFAESLDGPVLLNGTHLAEESELPFSAPFQIGLIIAAWIPSNTPDQASVWLEVTQQLQPASGASLSRDADVSASSASEGHLQESTSDADASVPDENLSIEKDFSEDDSEAPQVERRTLAQRARDLGLIAALVLVGTLCITWENEPKPMPEQTMRTLLDEAGYQSLQVVGNDESVSVTGRLATDRERGRLLRLAQMLPFPVYLDVTVRSDAADAVRASFNTLGLWPEVTELPPSSRPGVRVRGYIKNGVLEQQALSNAVRNIPALRASENGDKPSFEIFRDIKYEDDVQTVLTPALMLAGLEDVESIFHPGRVEMRGSLTPQHKAALEDIVRTVEAKLGVPVPFDIVNEAEVQTQKTNIYADQRSPDSRNAAPQKDKKASAFKVVSVSMGAMKFVTLETGERIFEGGELPGGYVLEHIAVDKLTLKKNGSTTNYPLRGNNE